MPPSKITNDMIYDLLKQQHEDILQFKTDATRRLSRLEGRVDAIYDERKQVTVRFTQSWAGASLVIAFFASFFSLGAYRVFFS